MDSSALMNAIAVNELWQKVGEVAHERRAARVSLQRQREFDRRTREAYLAALVQAKQSGEMPACLQKVVPVDEMLRQAGIKALALRELAKLNPQHPLVVSKNCREMVGKVTLVNYNRANRPDVVDIAPYVVGENIAQEIFTDFPGNI